MNVERNKLYLNGILQDMNTPLILGDSGLVFQVAGKRLFRTISSADYPLIAVLLPLGTNRFLVGGNRL